MPIYATTSEPIFIQPTDTHNATTNKQSTMKSELILSYNFDIYAPTSEKTFIQYINPHNSTTNKQLTLTYIVSSVGHYIYTTYIPVNTLIRNTPTDPCVL